MPNYEVLNDADEVINTIVADAEFMAANFSSYQEAVAPEPTDEEIVLPERSEEEIAETDAVLAQDARAWRDGELKSTDYIVPLSDHPQRAAYMTYRVALRDWPATEDFPDTKPEL